MSPSLDRGNTVMEFVGLWYQVLSRMMSNDDKARV